MNSKYLSLDDILLKPASFGVETSKSVTGSNTYYVITRSFGYRYFKGSGNGPWQETAKTATKFSSVADAALSVAEAKRGGNSDINIVKITETPGTEIRRELKETETKLSGEVVKYGIFGLLASRFTASATRFATALKIEEAVLFASQSAAIEAIAKAGHDGYGTKLGPVEIRRIAVRSAQPVVTETVLG